MPTKKKSAHKPAAHKHPTHKKHETEEEKPKASVVKQTVEVVEEESAPTESSIKAKDGYTPRLDQKDERSEEEKAEALEKAKAAKEETEDPKNKAKDPNAFRQVPHIDIPAVESRENDDVAPSWHATGEDLPSFAKPKDVPAPIPPSQPLTSAPPASGAPVGDSSAPRDLKEEVNVVPISEEYLPVDTGPVERHSARTEAKAEEPHRDIEVKETMPDPVDMLSEEKKKKGSFLYLLGGIVVGVVVLLGAFWGYMFVTKNGWLSFGGAKKPAPEANVSPSPKPTPVPVFDASLVGFEVLNGSGVRGAAASAADKLRDKGYTILATGNNPKTVNVTQLFVASSESKNQDKILADVTELFPEATLAGVLEDTNTTASARLILGKE